MLVSECERVASKLMCPPNRSRPVSMGLLTHLRKFVVVDREAGESGRVGMVILRADLCVRFDQRARPVSWLTQHIVVQPQCLIQLNADGDLAIPNAWCVVSRTQAGPDGDARIDRNACQILSQVLVQQLLCRCHAGHGTDRSAKQHRCGPRRASAPLSRLASFRPHATPHTINHDSDGYIRSRAGRHVCQTL